MVKGRWTVHVGPPQGKEKALRRSGGPGGSAPWFPPFGRTIHRVQAAKCSVFIAAGCCPGCRLYPQRRSTLHCLCGIPRCAAHLLRAFTVRQLGHVCGGVGSVPGRRVFRAARASASLAKSATVSRDASCSMRTRCESSEPLTRRRACWRLQSWLGLVLTDADRQTYPYLVEPVRVVRLSRCLRVGFSRFTRRTIVCLSEGKH